MKAYGIFGGTFNPIHTAHLILAEDLRQLLKLEKVIFIPSNNPPHKNHNELPDASQRMEMVNLAISDNPYFELSDIEMNPDTSYTIDTLSKLHKLHNGRIKYFLFIGSDQFTRLHEWKEPERLFELSEVVVINRPGYPPINPNSNFSDKAKFITVSKLEISSSDIRMRIKEKRSIKYLVHQNVEKFIYKNKLYY